MAQPDSQVSRRDLLEQSLSLSPDDRVRLFLALPGPHLPPSLPKDLRAKLISLDETGSQTLALDLFLHADNIRNDIMAAPARSVVRALSWACLPESGDRDPTPRAVHPLARLRGFFRAHSDAWRFLHPNLRHHPALLEVSPDPDDRSAAYATVRQDHPYQYLHRRRDRRNPKGPVV